MASWLDQKVASIDALINVIGDDVHLLTNANKIPMLNMVSVLNLGSNGTQLAKAIRMMQSHYYY